MDILDDFDDFTVQGTFGAGLGGTDIRVPDYDLAGLGLAHEDDFLVALPTTTADTQNLFSMGMGTWERNVTR